MEIKRNELGTYFYFKCKNDFKKGTIVFIHGWGTNSEYHNNFIKYIENFVNVPIKYCSVGPGQTDIKTF